MMPSATSSCRERLGRPRDASRPTAKNGEEFGTDVKEGPLAIATTLSAVSASPVGVAHTGFNNFRIFPRRKNGDAK